MCVCMERERQRALGFLESRPIGLYIFRAMKAFKTQLTWSLSKYYNKLTINGLLCSGLIDL